MRNSPLRASVTLLIAVAGGFSVTHAFANSYDGFWSVERTSIECPHKDKPFTISVTNGTIAGPRRGQVDSGGRFTMAFRNQAKHYVYSGQLSARTGTGTWRRTMFNGNADCGGQVTLRKLGT